jgi:rhodanese-related sulfurtransferase
MIKLMVQGLVSLVVLMLLPAVLLAGGYFQTIPMAEVAKLMGKPGVAILDANDPKVWQKHHIPGATHLDSADLARFLPADKSATLIFYCANQLCEASALAADESVVLGYRRVYVMTDGIFGWVKAGFPVETAVAAAEPAGETAAAPMSDGCEQGEVGHHAKQ